MKKAIFFLSLLLCGTLMAQQSSKVAELQAKADGGDVEAMITMGRVLTNGLYNVPFDSVRAFQYFQRAAEAGSGDAKSHLSRFYIWSSVVPHDTAKYIALLQEGHRAGSAHATTRLGTTYLSGLGVEKNEKLGKKYLNEALKRGCAYTYYVIGNQYNYGRNGYELNKEKANQYFIESIKRGEYVAYEELLLNLRLNDQCEQFLYWSNQASELDYMPVKQQMAIAHYWGKCAESDTVKALAITRELHNRYPTYYGASRLTAAILIEKPYCDTAEALKVLQRSADCNEGWAYSEMADIYRLAPKGSQYHNPSLAFSYYDKSWKSSPWACVNLGLTLFDSSNYCSPEHAIEVLRYAVDEFEDTLCAGLLSEYYISHGDTVRFVKYATMAARQFSSECLEYLKSIYIIPGAEKFFRPAGNTDYVDLLNELIAKGFTKGYYYLALVQDGQGNSSKALKTLEKGLNAGNDDCGYLLANCYRKGLATKVNTAKADKIYATINSGRALYNRAMMRLNGDIPAKSLQDIIPFLQQSADKHFLDAFVTLGLIYMDEGMGVLNPDVALGYFRRLCNEEGGKAEGYWRIANFYETRLSSDNYGHDNSDTANMIKYYTLAAEEGSADGWRFLADIYLAGSILPADTNKAFEYCKKAAEMDNGAGTYMLGKYHLNGYGTPIDTALAISYFYKAAAQGVGKACAYLGDFHKYGRGGFAPNFDTALYYYNIGSQSDDPTCDYEIANYLINNKQDYQRAVPYINSARKNGNPKANILLSQYYIKGILTNRNLETAKELLQEAANSGVAEAYTILGTLYFQQEQDLDKAILYLDTAAQMNDPQGSFIYGQLLLSGLGCEKDTVKALQVIDKAARMGWHRASNFIGDYYEQQEDYAKAVEYYELGVYQQSLQSYCNLGYCYEKGQGVVLNSQKAFENYMVAAEYHYGLGCFRVAMCYMEGTYVEENILKAEEWFLEGAKVNHAGSAYYLGMLYERGEKDANGNEVKADKKKAIQFYQMAADAGVDAAKNALDRLKGKSK